MSRWDKNKVTLPTISSNPRRFISSGRYAKCFKQLLQY